MNKNNIIIETVAADDVIKADGILYNTNNHWILTRKPPDDYDYMLNKNITKNWIHLKMIS